MQADFISKDLQLAIDVLGIAQSAVKSDYGLFRSVFNPETQAIDSAIVVAGDRVVIEHLLPVSIDKEVEFGFPISKIKPITSDPPSPKISILDTLKGGKIENGFTIKCGQFSAKLVEPITDACPQFLENIECPDTIVSAAQLAVALKKVKASIFTDSAEVKQAARKIIDGVMFMGNGSNLTLFSTDNNRLAKASIACTLNKSFVLSKETVIASHQLLEKEDDTEVSIGLRYANEDSSDIRGFRLVVGKSRLTSGVMAGKPPTSIESFFAKELPNKIEINTADLKKAIARLAIFSEENTVIMSISKDGAIEIHAWNYLSGEASDKLLGINNVGADRKIKINHSYMTDALAASNKVLLEHDDTTVRITHLDCPYNTQHVIGQMRQ